MREIRQSGSAGGGSELNRSSLPRSRHSRGVNFLLEYVRDHRALTIALSRRTWLALVRFESVCARALGTVWLVVQNVASELWKDL
jgi:hypothetical protein